MVIYKNIIQKPENELKNEFSIAAECRGISITGASKILAISNYTTHL